MIKALILNFCRNNNGSILPIFGALVLMMVVIGGAAIDISRAVNAREKLAYAIDAAALSVAADLSTTVLTNSQITDKIENSFRANLVNAEFLDQAIENLNFVVDSDEGTVTVSSSAGLNNYFLNIPGFGKDGLGPEVFNFGTSAQVNYSRFDVELALVVDVTGSMSGDMATLRTASEGIVDILLPEDTPAEDTKVKISLVPYSAGVNVGSYATTVSNGESSRCVTERMGTQKYTDDPYDWDPSAAASSFFGGGSTSCSSASQLIPLTNDRDTLVPAIRALQASGITAGQTGTAWGWYTISPNWTNLWPSESAPAVYTDTEVLKFAIIMTDGNNNRHYDRKRRCRNGSCWWYWDVDSDSGYSGDSSTRARQICTNMKAEGITIYGVYFGTSSTSTGARNMKACATDEDTTYYQATSASELIQAFSNIAKRIQQIYLSQ
ncbi:pilus assembly protein TadG-related protein [Roseibium sp.]|uniref:pilus assembly protein TadG-related protein n=1 Tax=Roseibium sp. TaxID=1936156 RepID=UPI003B509F9D